MLEQVLAFMLFLFFTGYQGQDSTNDVIGLSGASLWLQPRDIQPMTHSVQWKVQFSSNRTWFVILTWKNGSGLNFEPWVLKHFNNRLNFTIKDFTLLIMAVQQQDRGVYFLEVTYMSGKVSGIQFQVLVFDPVKELSLQEQWKALDRGLCQVTLTCLVPSDGGVSYAWYRGSELMPQPRNLTHLELLVDADGLPTYTCNASNPVSWKSHTFHLTQGCWRAHKKFRFLPVLVLILVLLIILFLSTLTCFCVRRKKVKQSDTGTEEFLTVYTDVNNLQIRRDQEQEQNSPGEGRTIYSMIQPQHSASTTQDPVMTIYSSVQPSWKSGSKKRNRSPSFNRTTYEEVGRRQPRAQNSARLSHQELENFHVYS